MNAGFKDTGVLLEFELQRDFGQPCIYPTWTSGNILEVASHKTMQFCASIAFLRSPSKAFFFSEMGAVTTLALFSKISGMVVGHDHN